MPSVQQLRAWLLTHKPPPTCRMPLHPLAACLGKPVWRHAACCTPPCSNSIPATPYKDSPTTSVLPASFRCTMYGRYESNLARFPNLQPGVALPNLHRPAPSVVCVSALAAVCVLPTMPFPCAGYEAAPSRIPATSSATEPALYATSTGVLREGQGRLCAPPPLPSPMHPPPCGACATSLGNPLSPPLLPRLRHRDAPSPRTRLRTTTEGGPLQDVDAVRQYDAQSWLHPSDSSCLFAGLASHRRPCHAAHGWGRRFACKPHNATRTASATCTTNPWLPRTGTEMPRNFHASGLKHTIPCFLRVCRSREIGPCLPAAFCNPPPKGLWSLVLLLVCLPMLCKPVGPHYFRLPFPGVLH